MRPSLLLAAAIVLSCVALPVVAKDPAIERALKAADLEYEVDDDGDYKIVVEWDKEKRSQLVYVSGTFEELSDVKVMTVFSPAYVTGPEGIDGARARHLLEENAKSKVGAWEVAGKNLYFTTKFPAGLDAEQFHRMVLTTAEVADNMELELTPGKDEL